MRQDFFGRSVTSLPVRDDVDCLQILFLLIYRSDFCKAVEVLSRTAKMNSKMGEIIPRTAQTPG